MLTGPNMMHVACMNPDLQALHLADLELIADAAKGGGGSVRGVGLTHFSLFAPQAIKHADVCDVTC